MYTPPLPPVTTPAARLLVSVRSPPERTLMTQPLPLCVIECPFRSSVTAFVTDRDALPFVATMSSVSVTVPPASSSACSSSHVMSGRRRSSPFTLSTTSAGSSPKKRASSPAAAPVANATGEYTAGASSVVTPMRVPAERPLEWNVRAQR